MLLTQNEKTYRTTVNRLCGSLLVFISLFFVYSIFMSLIMPLLIKGMSERSADVVYQLVYGLLYAAVFMLPVLFFRLISKDDPVIPLSAAPRLPRNAGAYVAIAIAVVSAAATLNSVLLDVFNYSDFADEHFFNDEVMSNYQLVLALFTTAVIPAFVEEFLYRGLILCNLLPYGRDTAILASSLLFGLMHQNAGQFLYAAIAGLVLGYLYVHTGSIWCGVLAHFANNAMSVIFTAIYQRMPSPKANAICLLIQAAICVIGVACFISLILRAKNPANEAKKTGCFEVDLPPEPDNAAIEIPFRRRIRLFFAPTTVIFCAICAVQMLLFILLAAMNA